MPQLTIDKLIKIAESLNWKTKPCSFAGNEKGYEISKYSPAGQDFIISIKSTNGGKENHQTLIDNLDHYINSYDPSEEALLWVGPDGHGKNGAPHELKDIITDMEACLGMMKELLQAWKGTDGKTPAPFTVYRIIRIDGQFDTDKHESVDQAVENAIAKVINDAMAHSHTIEDGIQITDVTDCGEAT